MNSQKNIKLAALPSLDFCLFVCCLIKLAGNVGDGSIQGSAVDLGGGALLICTVVSRKAEVCLTQASFSTSVLSDPELAILPSLPGT